MKWKFDLQAMVDWHKFEPMDWKTLKQLNDAMQTSYPGDYKVEWDFDRASAKLKFENEAEGLFWMLRNS